MRANAAAVLRALAGQPGPRLLPFQREFVVAAWAADISALSSPRGSGKTMLLGRLAALAVTPGSRCIIRGRKLWWWPGRLTKGGFWRLRQRMRFHRIISRGLDWRLARLTGSSGGTWRAVRPSAFFLLAEKSARSRGEEPPIFGRRTQQLGRAFWFPHDSSSRGKFGEAAGLPPACDRHFESV